MSVVEDEMFVEVLRGICLCAGVWLQLTFFSGWKTGMQHFFLDVMQITCERGVYTGKNRDEER